MMPTGNEDRVRKATTRFAFAVGEKAVSCCVKWAPSASFDDFGVVFIYIL